MSDHANLQYFGTSQHLLDRQACWASFLSSFNFVIRHIRGKLNPADPFTRQPDYLPEGEVDTVGRTLLIKVEGGFAMADSSLDDVDPRVDVGEVNLTDAPPLVQQELDSADESDFDPTFCSPSSSLSSLLQQAYKDDPPNPEDQGLSQQGHRWWY